ncbi:uncharacterized protein LOC142231430 [Haematobia irritans]|uniref:uncharacterized protein LOC142231430 n=1 Tax=Haematobia irritans TaxID=7368 RepID=UPI003F4FAC14
MSDTNKYFGIEKLNQDNYYNWKFKMKMYLIKESLWDVVESSPAERNQAWIKKDKEAFALISLCVEDSQLIHIRNQETSKEAWNSLQSQHERITLTSKVTLMRKICNMHMSDGGDMQTHINTMMELFDKLAATGYTNFTEAWQVSMLLSSLPASYDSLITALEVRPDKDLTLDMVKAKLMEEYFKRNVRESVSEIPVLNTFQNPKKKDLQCCYFCKRPGHIKINCQKYQDWCKRNKIVANITESNVDGNSNQCNEFVLMTASGGGEESVWIIDSGASCHIAQDSKLFHSIDTNIASSIISVANGNTSMSKGKGVCKIKTAFTNLCVMDVYFVPDFNSNLLSVRKMTEKGYKVAYTIGIEFLVITTNKTLKGYKRKNWWIILLLLVVIKTTGHVNLRKEDAAMENNSGYTKGSDCTTSQNSDNLNESSILENLLSDTEHISDSNEFYEDAIQSPIAERRTSNRSNKGIAPQRYEANSITLFKDPSNFNEAISIKEEKKLWISAMNDELKSIIDNKTWELVDLPEGRKAIGCKWVFKKKTNEKGQIIRYKARLVAQGYNQKFGVDYDEVFAPVVRQTTTRTLFSIAGKEKMHLYHFDVKTAFLNGDLKETIYMKQPPGFQSNEKADKVCLLKKSLYGLKQAARSWNQCIHNALIECNFRQSEIDPCLYICTSNSELHYLLVYVDDIILASKSNQFIEESFTALSKKFSIENLGPVKYYLGMEVERDSEGNYMLKQESYIKKVVDMFGLNDAKASDIPLSPGYNRTPESEKLLSNSLYQRAIGCLLYLSTHTRPDITASVSILSQKTENPSVEDWNEIKRLIKYLKGTSNLALKLSNKKASDKLYGYVDADWGENKVDRKSNSGYIFYLNGGVISWSCRKQTCVSLSTAEAEFVALVEGFKEAKWINELLTDMCCNAVIPITIYEDNQSCIKMMVDDGNCNNDTANVKGFIHWLVIGFLGCIVKGLIANHMNECADLRNTNTEERNCTTFYGIFSCIQFTCHQDINITAIVSITTQSSGLPVPKLKLAIKLLIKTPCGFNLVADEYCLLCEFEFSVLESSSQKLGRVLCNLIVIEIFLQLL